MNIEKLEKETKQKINYYKEIESTHLHAKEIQNKGDVVLIAEVQTAGIGTKGRKWHTGENKNIAMTIIKHPKCKVSELEGLTIKIAEDIKEVIKEMYGYELQIKIPNDLILNNKKICGTGTIDESGNIGEIGGVKYKMLGASKNKCDVFITPKENYEEAFNILLNTTITSSSVKVFLLSEKVNEYAIDFLSKPTPTPV